MSETICGREYTIVKPIVHPKTVYKGKKPYPKIVVEGLNHSTGKPIRFRSLKNAETYIVQHNLQRN